MKGQRSNEVPLPGAGVDNAPHYVGSLTVRHTGWFLAVDTDLNKNESFTLCPVYGSEFFAMSGTMMDPGGNEDNLHKTGSIGSLIPVGPITEQALPVGIHLSDPLKSNSCAYFQSEAPKRCLTSLFSSISLSSWPLATAQESVKLEEGWSRGVLRAMKMALSSVH